MAIDFDQFYEWACEYFGEENLSTARGGEEICTYSPWRDGSKKKLWMNPSGGKSEHPEFGSFRCWYTDRKGSLVKLVSMLEDLTWDEAEARITPSTSLRAIDEEVRNMFAGRTNAPSAYEAPPEAPSGSSNVGRVRMPDGSFPLKRDSCDPVSRRAIQILDDRAIPIEGIWAAGSGEYRDRIIIPYLDSEGRLIWFNARTMREDDRVIKYMKPNEACGAAEADQDDVLFFRRWPKPGLRVMIAEGEFDAMALDLAGFHATACGGKTLKEGDRMQAAMLRGRPITIALDSEQAGLDATIRMGRMFLANGFTNISYVRPPAKFKDWNELYKIKGPDKLAAYVHARTKPFHSWTAEELGAQNL